MSEHAGKEHKNWIVTFAAATGLFVVLYLFTLWFGNGLVGDEHHDAGDAAHASTDH
ncbi:MAG: hypothetical protein J4G09_00440 [Proteobacteria bacterium]|nr:hypothetical protein [Pseudomonadota bacterium]